MVDDDLFAAFETDPEDGGADDDLFAGFDSGGAADDPFASLDTDDADDPFAALSGEDDDDLFGAPPAPAPEPPPVTDAGRGATDAGDERPAWLRELGGFDDEDTSLAEPVRAPAKSSGGSGVLTTFTGSGPKGMAFGMTAQQRMILSIFLFLDIAVLGCLMLLTIGAIAPPLP